MTGRGVERSTPASVVDAGSDAALLRRFEPVIRYTAGELFLPCGVESYVAACSLWEHHRGQLACLVPAGQLTMDRLVSTTSDQPDAELSLRYVESPLDRAAFRTWRRRPERPQFRTHGRFAQVGLTSRLVDALFRLILLARGRVPGGHAAAAEIADRSSRDGQVHPYYGRVVREGGYVVLQYWFFYAMNDWRSSFSGANDHEADWEQMTVYLADDPATGLRPSWVALSAHDEIGADLRRRWDDPEISREGDHPVVFAGAGSHSGSFVAGDYITTVQPPPSFRLAFSALQKVARLLTPWSRGELQRGLGIPFVDYARGDGPTIGPGHERAWTLAMIDDDTPWVRHYWGLWGLDTRDRFGGERAPAGPQFERGGAIRLSWSNPLGWAGLHGEPPTSAEWHELLRERVGSIDSELAELDADLAEQRRHVRTVVAGVESMHGRAGLARRATTDRRAIAEAERALDGLMATRAELIAARAAHLHSLELPRPAVPPQHHLHHKAAPIGTERDERTRMLRIWSTLSAPLLFLAAAFIVADDRVGVRIGLGALALVFLTIEAVARRRLLAFASTLGVAVIAGLAAIAVVQGLLGQWQILIATILAAIGAIVLRANVRDLRRGR